MSLTISDLPKDCWGEILSHIPEKKYPTLLCVSCLFTQNTMEYLNEKTTKIFNQFLKIIHEFHPNLISIEICFTASNLFNLKKETRIYETTIARALSKIEFSLKDPFVKAGLYEEVSWFFYLASLLIKGAEPGDIRALVKHGYLNNIIEFAARNYNFKDELIFLAMSCQEQISDLIKPENFPESFLNQIKDAIHTVMLRQGKIEEFLKINPPMNAELKVELAAAYASKADLENSMIIYDSIGKDHYHEQIDCLIRIGVYFAKAGNFQGILEVESRARTLPTYERTRKAPVKEEHPPRITSRAHFWPSNFGDNEVYQVSYFEKIVDEHWQSMCEEPVFEPLVFKKLVQLNENDKVKEYIKRALEEQRPDVFDFLIRNDKGFLVEKPCELFHDLERLYHFEQGGNIRTVFLEEKWLFQMPQNIPMLSRLVAVYLQKKDFKKCMFIANETLNSNDRSDIFQQMGIELAKQNLFELACDILKEVDDINDRANAFSYLANYAARSGTFVYLGALSSVLQGVSLEDVFPFALEDSFNPPSLLVLTEEELRSISRALIPFLIKKGKVQNAIVLYSLTKELIESDDLQFSIGKVCAENGFIELAREAAERVVDKNQYKYYQLLLTIRLNKEG